MRECENCFYAISINDDRDIFCVCVENKGKRLRNDCELQSGCDYFRAAWSIPQLNSLRPFSRRRENGRREETENEKDKD